MKHLALALAMAFAASAASAAIVSTNNFETAYDDFSAVGGDIASLVSLVDYEQSGQPSGPAPAPFSDFGSKYMSLDTDDAMVWRTFTEQSSAVYFDSYVKMTPCLGDIEYTSDAKFVVFLNADTNLCVISGTSAGNHAPVTNVLAAVSQVESWHRLTVCASADGGYTFSVFLDGTRLGETFYSLVAGTTMSNVGLKGTGAIDDLVVRTTAPVLSGTAAATIDGEDFATLEDALAAANGKTVTLSGDHPGTAAVTASGTYVINKGSYNFGGIDDTDGSFVSSSPSGNVVTYTVKKLVAMWDGAAAAYDFSALTRTLGDNTYTLNLNPVGSANTVAADSSCIQIADADAQCGVTITTQNSNPAVTNGFSVSGTVSVLMKCRDMPVTADSNRAIISLMDGGKYKYGGTTQQDNGAVLGMYIINGTSGWMWRGSTADRAGLSGNLLNTVSGKFSADEQVVALTYSNSGGTCYYVNGELAQSESALKDSTGLARPYGIALGGVDVSTGNQFFALKNMKIEAIAVFSSTLTADEVAAYKFPSETPMSGTVNVSDINALFGTKSDITVHLANDTTVTGDTTFNASTVRFVCDGSFTMTPPAGNVATFDFGGVTGKPVIEYTAMPTVSGSVFTSTTVPTWVTDSTMWTGVILLNGVEFTDFTSNAYGNEMSVVRLKNAKGWFKTGSTTPHTNNVPVEVVGTLSINNGNSADGSHKSRCSVFKKLSGSGKINTNATGAGTVVVIQDASEFTGGLGLNSGKYIVFGEAMPDYDTVLQSTTVGTIFVMAGVTMTNSNFWWATGGIQVYGELRAPNHKDYFGGGTTITTSDTGVFTLTSTGDGSETETDTNYSRITGTGTLKYEGSGWRALSTNNFPIAMTLEDEQAGAILLSRALTYTIGSLSGSKNFQGNYGSAGENSRKLRVLQSKDTTWSGKIKEDGSSRLGELSVAPGTGSSPTGTLTLAGTQTQSVTLTVEAGAKVNLVGKWVGPVTVNGALSGTGVITGDVTVSDGATLKLSNAADQLAVTGNLTVTGTVNIELPAAAGSVAVITAKGTIDVSGAAFRVTRGGVPLSCRIGVSNGGLRIAPKVTVLTFF